MCIRSVCIRFCNYSFFLLYIQHCLLYNLVLCFRTLEMSYPSFWFMYFAYCLKIFPWLLQLGKQCIISCIIVFFMMLSSSSITHGLISIVCFLYFRYFITFLLPIFSTYIVLVSGSSCLHAPYRLLFLFEIWISMFPMSFHLFVPYIFLFKYSILFLFLLAVFSISVISYRFLK